MDTNQLARLTKKLANKQEQIEQTLAELARFENYSALDMRVDHVKHIDRLKKKLYDQQWSLHDLELLIAATLVQE